MTVFFMFNEHDVFARDVSKYKKTVVAYTFLIGFD